MDLWGVQAYYPSFNSLANLSLFRGLYQGQPIVLLESSPGLAQACPLLA